MVVISLCLPLSKKGVKRQGGASWRDGASGPFIYTPRVLAGGICAPSVRFPSALPAPQSRAGKNLAKPGPRATYSYLRRVHCTFGATEFKLLLIFQKTCDRRARLEPPSDDGGGSCWSPSSILILQQQIVSSRNVKRDVNLITWFLRLQQACIILFFNTVPLLDGPISLKR